MTFGEIVRRFDVLYHNSIPYEDKLKHLYQFDRETFPWYYANLAPRKTIKEIEHTEPTMKLPHDGIYITVLALYKSKLTGNAEAERIAQDLLNRSLDMYISKYVMGQRVCRITSYDENGMPTAWVDDLGGVHDGGCGTDPYGNDCGECSSIVCFGCRMLHQTTYKEEEE